MQDFALTAIVTVIALLLYFFMGLRVGMARGKYGVVAPATSGDPMFERHFRVHMNTLEWMPLFLPSLWMFAGFWGDLAAALLGTAWIFARAAYMVSYVADPAKRGLGFGLQALATLVLIIGSLAGAIMALLR